MKKILMFTMAGCPFCKRAHRFIEEILRENPQYQQCEIEIVDETRHREYARRFEYYYVPTFYVDGVKVHEGVASKNTILRVFETACKR